MITAIMIIKNLGPPAVENLSPETIGDWEELSNTLILKLLKTLIKWSVDKIKLCRAAEIWTRTKTSQTSRATVTPQPDIYTFLITNLYKTKPKIKAKTPFHQNPLVTISWIQESVANQTPNAERKIQICFVLLLMCPR